MIVIKVNNEKAEPTAKKLYRHNFVDDGTLLCLDFSNKGTLKNESIISGASVFDLAREAANPLGISNEITVITTPTFTLTAGKGVNLAESGITGTNKGLVFNDSLLNYLVTNNPHLLMSMWVRKISNNGGSQLIRSFAGTDYTNTSIRATLSNDNLTVTLGGSAGTPVTCPNGELVQVAAEFISGQPTKSYKNGSLAGAGNDNGGFIAGATGWGFPKMETSTIPDTTIYLISFYNLGISGKNAIEVLENENDYVKGTGKYEGIEVRPFVTVA